MALKILYLSSINYNKKLGSEMFICHIGQYNFHLFSGNLPAMYCDLYLPFAQLIDEINLDIRETDPADSSICFLAVQRDGTVGKYVLVLALGYSPSEPAFMPAMIFVPETDTVYIGAGESALAYQLDPPVKRSEVEANVGFLSWERHLQYIMMRAEMKIAVWDLSGKLLWSQFVEPPYTYTLANNTMYLTIVGKTFSFPLDTGPQSPLQWM